MKLSKISPQLIADQTTATKTSSELAPYELQKLADFVSLLATIDRKNKTKEEHKEKKL